MTRKRMRKRAASRLVTAAMVSDFIEGISGQSERPSPSERLAEILNGAKLSHESCARVESIIQMLAQRNWFISHYEEIKPTAHSLPWQSTRFDALVARTLGDGFRLNELLEHYRVIPQIDPFGNRFFYRAADSSSSPPRSENAEIAAVMCALQLAERDELDRVRNCNCGRYFVAGRVDQNHCSTACRVKAHQSSEEFKAKRRKADRERYRLHKHGAVKESNRRTNGTQKTR